MRHSVRMELAGTTSVLVLLALLGLASASVAGALPTPHKVGTPEADARDGAWLAVDHYCAALRSMPADSVAACYDTDGALLLPGLPALEGRVAIRDFLAPMAAAVAVDSTSMEVDRDLAAPTFVSQWGTYRQVAGPRGGVHDLHVGRFSALWVYNKVEGRWLIKRLMMQPLPTPTTPAAAPAPGSSSGAPTPGK